MPYLVYSEQVLRLVLFGSDPSPLHKENAPTDCAELPASSFVIMVISPYHICIF